MKLRWRTPWLAFGLVMAWLLVVPQVHASSIFSELFFGETNLASDDSGEKLLDVAVGGTPGVIDVGDVFVGVFQIQSLTDLTGGGGNKNFGIDWTDEFTGVFQVEVASKLGGGGAATFLTLKDTGGVDFIGVPGGWAAGTIIGTFTDPANDFSRTGATLAGDLASGAGGARALDLGFLVPATANTGATGEGFTAFVGNDMIALLSAIPPPAPIGFFSAGLNATAIYAPSAGIVYAPVPVTDTTGILFGGGAKFGGTAQFGVQGSSTGVAGVTTTFDLFDDANIVFQPNVPEPASMMLVGASLVAAGISAGARRLRRKKSED